MPWPLPVPPERDALVERDVAADDRRLADHDAGGVVDKQPATQQRAGMNIDARIETSDLREYARGQTQLHAPEAVRYAMEPYGPQPRIAKHDLQRGARGGVALQD